MFLCDCSPPHNSSDALSSLNLLSFVGVHLHSACVKRRSVSLTVSRLLFQVAEEQRDPSVVGLRFLRVFLPRETVSHFCAAFYIHTMGTVC